MKTRIISGCLKHIAKNTSVIASLDEVKAWQSPNYGKRTYPINGKNLFNQGDYDNLPDGKFSNDRNLQNAILRANKSFCLKQLI